MKGRFWKKVTAGALALLLVSGGVPVQPIAEYLNPAVTASADTNTKSVTTDSDFGRLDGPWYYVYPGTYILQNDIELNGTIQCSDAGDYTIDLNGHQLKQTRNYEVIDLLDSNHKLTIKDSSQDKTGMITGGKRSGQGAGIYNNGGTVVLLGGKITGNTMTAYGTGAGVYNDGTFIMLGGEISGNNNTYNNNTDNVRNNGNFYILNTLPGIDAFDGKAAQKIGCSVTTSVTGKGVLTAAPTTITAAGQTYTVSGSSVSLNVSPDDGYRLTGLSAVDGDSQNVPIHYNADTEKYEFTMPDGDVTVSAEFEQYHTVTWNVDGTTTSIYPAHGAVPVYEGDTPAKAADAQYTYTFSGWSDGTNTYGINDTLPAVTADVTYTAVFGTTTNEYTVTWKDGNDVLETDENVPYGTAPSFDGTMPSRTDTPQYTYTLNGWNDGNTTYTVENLPTVSGNVTYTADFAQTVKKYTVNLPANMKITNGVTLSGGKADYGTVIKLAPADAMTVSGNVTVNGTVLSPDESGEYTVTVTQNTDVQAEIKRHIDYLTEIRFVEDEFDEGLGYPYDGIPKTPVVEIKDYSDGWGDGLKTLVLGTDYTVSYSNNTGLSTEAVTATVTITGIGDYAGTATKTFRISPFSISDTACEISVPDQTLDDYAYINYKFEAAQFDSDVAKQIGATVTYGNKVLTFGTDYTFGNVVYADMTGHDEWDMPEHLGDKCKVEIIGKGDYIGMKLSNVFTLISPEASGTLGDLNWELKNGKLTITGSGAMTEYNSYTDYTWFRFSSYITEIEICDGVTSVAANAFAGSSNMTYYYEVQTVTLPSTVKTIGDYAFAYMTGLKTIDLSHVTTIGTYAFTQCASLEITVPATVTSLAEDAFTGCVSSKFTIKWVNYDGTMLATTIANYGYEGDPAPSYSGKTVPTKPADMQYTYTFSGWSPPPVPAHTNKTYTAQFDSTVNQYAVTFKNQDGTVLDTISFDYGTKPVYPNRVYEKLSDQYSMVIESWSDGANTYAFDDLPTVSGTAEYTANIVQDENRYTVTWKNWDGTVLETDENVLYNTTPTYNGETPTKTVTWEGRSDIYNFTFSGWDKTLDPVSTDVTYTAQFSCEGLDSYMDGETLVLKGNLRIVNPNNSYYAILMPLNADGTAPVDRNYVKHIRVDDAGATFPANSTNMFLGFHNVTDIDLTGANTSNVTNMNSMFWYCESLTALDISSFDTSHVTDMSEMFCNCFDITEIDLSAFDTSSLTIIRDMFAGCRKLETIYVGNKWTTDNIADKTLRVFYECEKLLGEKGSLFSYSYKNANYACIDGGSSARGYLTSKYYVNITNGDYCTADRSFVTGKAESRLVLISPTAGNILTGLTVTCGDTPVSANDERGGTFSFYMQREDAVVTATVLGSDKCYFDKRTSTLHLRGNVNYNDVQGYKDNALYVVAEPGSVLPQDSSGLFSVFTAVKSIDLSNADTSSVTNMNSMFFKCESLTSLNLSSFDTRNVIYMSAMFELCKKLSSLDLSGFDTGNVTDMSYMFQHCGELTTIYVSEKWNTTGADNSGYPAHTRLLFENCTKLIGGNGTNYTASYMDTSYACIDKPGQPGYLTGVYSLTLPLEMETATDAVADYKVGSRYLKGAVVKVRPKTGYTASNVKANDTVLTDDGNDVYTVTIPDSNVNVTAEFGLSDGVGARVEGYSISLEQDSGIGINFYMSVDADIAANGTMRMKFEIPSYDEYSTQYVPISQEQQVQVGGKTYYVFKCSVAAKEMTSTIKAQIVYNDGTEEKAGALYTYSVKDYADYVIANAAKMDAAAGSGSTIYRDAVPLLRAMLKFGAESQKYFKYHTENPAYTDNEEPQGYAEIPDSIASDNYDDDAFNAYNIVYYGSSMKLKSKTSYLLYFTKAPSFTALPTVKKGETVITPAMKGDYVIYEIKDIDAGKLTEAITLTFNETAFTFHPSTYLKKAKSDDEVKDLAKAMYNYDLQAKKYAGRTHQ